MSQRMNIYCDESCHLENDRSPVMVLGAVGCPVSETKRISSDIQELKLKHRAAGELKWVKVSPARIDFYRGVVDYFFGEPNLWFRAWIIRDKFKLNHDYFNQGSHDSFYYKMYYYMLDPLIKPPGVYYVYLDVKDTRSSRRVRKLWDVLCNKKRDFEKDLIARVQSVRSDEVVLMQLADLLIGAVCYGNKPELVKSEAKQEVVRHVEKKLRRKVIGSTTGSEEKFNFFTFIPSEVDK